jgi:DNA-binding transcriptional MocR family regulator
MTETRAIAAEWLAARLNDCSSRGIAVETSALIRSGVIPIGARMPTVRDLAFALGVSPATVSAAWSELRRFNVIAGRGRTGIQVSGNKAALPPSRFDLNGHFRAGVVDLTLAVPDLALLPPLDEALSKAARVEGLNGYERTPILDRLRNAVAPRWAYAADAYLAANGGYDAVHVTLQALLLPGALVAVEEPTAMRLLDIIDEVGAYMVPVTCDDAGPTPTGLAAAMRRKPDAFLFQPRTHCITGHRVTRRRMSELADVLRGSDTLIIEDDGIGDVSDLPPASLGERFPDRVVHIRSFSKSLGPDLRLAVLSGSNDIVDRIQGVRAFGVGWTSRILQSVAADLIVDPATDALLAAARRVYAERRRALLERLQTRGIALPDRDGLCVWLPVRSEQFALVTLAARNIAVNPGRKYAIRELGHVRVATSLPIDKLDEVAEALALVYQAPADAPPERVNKRRRI